MLSFKNQCRYFHKSDLLRKSTKIKLEDFFEGQNIKKSNLPGLHYKPFAEWVEERRSEAKRTLMVQVKSQESAQDLLNYCTSKFGDVRSMHFHRNLDSHIFSDFFLVELESKESLKAALEKCSTYRSDAGSQPIPVSSPFLWFSGKKELESASTARPTSDVHVSSKPEVRKTDEELENIFSNCLTVDDQMNALHEETKLSNLSTRLRFLACEQLELAMSGMFPQGKVLPFGSSVNSFGKSDADLDMVYDLEIESKESDSRLWFHVKVNKAGGLKMLKRRYCYQMANVIQHMLPGCLDVQNIAGARVPIVKYRQQFLGLECDLTTSMSGYYMSELLYLYGELDSRVRPLVFTIRKWAKGQGLIIDARPTPLFTNFTLTLMAIFFLQCRYQMLPPFQDLQRAARKEDHLVCENDVDCTFLRDVSGYQTVLNQQWENQPHLNPGELSLAQMLTDFFDFYSHYDFKRKAVCVVAGRPTPKRAASTSNKVNDGKVSFFIDVTNPLERDLNVAGNVQENAVALFQKKCRESLRKMFLLNKGEHDAGTSKLSHIFSGETPKLGVSLKELAQLSEDAERKKAAPPKPDVSHEERRFQETRKKKLLRVPKIEDL